MLSSVLILAALFGAAPASDDSRETTPPASRVMQGRPAFEGRAVWEHAGTGAFPGHWDRSAKLLADHGFNMVISNMLSSGEAHYASDVLPRSAVFREYGDQIQQCCDAAKKYGLQVHVWKVCFNLLGASQEWREQLRRDGRTQVTMDGKFQPWLCPSNPDNRKLELDAILEVACKYPVDGLHFDYIRYPGNQTCYCDGCRKRFEADSGQNVADWPADCYAGTRKEDYNNWRCQQITALVEVVSREARRIRNGIKISAAVFPYPSCRQTRAQDWPAWIKAGYLDFLCPMDYTPSEERFGATVAEELRLIDGRIPLYPGIGATATGMTLTRDQVTAQIRKAKELGAAGFTIFNFDAKTAESIIPFCGPEATAEGSNP